MFKLEPSEDFFSTTTTINYGDILIIQIIVIILFINTLYLMTLIFKEFKKLLKK